jgi:uncharacterized protein (TIRG00374 family)
MIGTLTNNLVPGRLGDVARSGMIGRLVPAVGISGALATVVLEKVVDGLTLLALLGLAFIMAPLPLWLAQTGGFASLIFLGLLLLLLVVNVHGKANRAKDIATDQSPKEMLRVIRGLLQRFALGLNALNSKRQALIIVTLTFAIWLLEFSFIFLAFLMFGLNLTFLAALVTGVILSMAMMLPAAPGAIGTYQFFTVAALQFYHVPESQALALAVFLNLFVFAFSTLVGLLALSFEGVNLLSGWRSLSCDPLVSNRQR